MEELKSFEFHFENLAFEGGGVKMFGHVGVIKVLEELGMMKGVKRFAGTSGGSIIAMLASVGASADDMLDMTNINFRKTYIDAFWGMLSILPNMFNHYGWNPGSKFLDHMEEQMERITGIKQITFKQIYDKYGTELCVVCTDVSTMSVKYFHPKTTPNTPVALAVKCSSALPGFLQPPTVSFGGDPHYMTDGGIICSFPLHVFDGWFLSMDIEDSFLNKLKKDSDPFGEFNAKTLGCLLMSVGDGDLFQGYLASRSPQKPKRPGTKLAKRNALYCDVVADKKLNEQQILEAGERFFKCLKAADKDGNQTINLEEFKAAIYNLKKEDQQLFFKGSEGTVEELYKNMELLDGEKEISAVDFHTYMQKKGVDFLAMLEGGNMVEIDSLGGFFGTLSGIMINVTRMTHRKQHDLIRTIGINTDYVQTADFDLELEDIKFLVQQGKVAAVDYLINLISKKKTGELPPEYADVITDAPLSAPAPESTSRHAEPEQSEETSAEHRQSEQCSTQTE